MPTLDRREPVLGRLIEDLSRPDAFAPARVGRVDVVQTHISVVFLAGDRVLKLKKPVDLGFVDYSTLARRRACCEAEVALNRRLAPDVYLRAAPITLERGRLRVGGPEDEAVEWAVEMRRLPDEARLGALVAREAAGPALLEALGWRLAAFHASARRGPDVARWATLDLVARHCRDNVTDVRRWVGTIVSAPVLARVARLTEDALARLGPTIAARAALACDGHGDLRLEHVYVQGDEVRIIDCVEFSDELRCGDPVSDVAFLAMELCRAGRRDLADALVAAWTEASGDRAGVALFPFYVAYRAMVRAKVDGFTAAAPEVPAAQRERSVARARGHALLALGELAAPAERPALVLLAGLPGTGKSVLAEQLARQAGCAWLRMDALRKELGAEAGLGSERGGAWGEGLYAPAFTERTYARALERATAAWFEGGRVIVDACFASEARRAAFLDAARAWGVRAVVLHLTAPAAVTHARLDARTGDPSDADRATHDRMAAAWEPFGPAAARAVQTVDASGTPDDTLARALEALRAAGLR